jgi:hypothetical protein
MTDFQEERSKKHYRRSTGKKSDGGLFGSVTGFCKTAPRPARCRDALRSVLRPKFFTEKTDKQCSFPGKEIVNQ